MDNTFNFEGIKINQDLLERTNPIFNTARMTLYQLAAAGHDDAKAIAERLNLTREDTRIVRQLMQMLLNFLSAVLLWK